MNNESKGKVAIFTLPFTWNYGGILQAHALSTFIEQSGYTPIVFSHRKRRKNFVFNYLVEIKWYLLRVLGWLKLYGLHRLIAVEKFKQTRLSKVYDAPFSRARLLNVLRREGVDTLLVGSDQVWRKEAIPDLDHYFLNVSKDRDEFKKVTYACSMGHSRWDYPESETKKIRSYISDIKISVREIDTVKTFSDTFDVEARLDLDPTLLLGTQSYEKCATVPKEKNYIFTYILDESSEKINFIASIQNEMNLTLLDFLSLPKQRQKVEDWLGCFMNSKFVVTDSYHGMIFSIIFRKPFVVIGNPKRGMSRFTSFLSKLELDDRLMCTNLSEVEFKKINEINWRQVEKKISGMRRDSSNYLLEALSND